MIKKTIQLNYEEGIHARPASVIVDEAKVYSSKINIIKDNKEVNAKSIMGIMSLGIKHGEKLTIKVDGEDEKEALAKLVEVFENF